MKHTPGQWIASFGWNQDDHTYVWGKDKDDRVIFMTPDNFKSVPAKEQEANAQLIAAAPDLLQTLVHVMEHLKAYAGDNSVLNERSALYYSVGKTIAKASGL